MKKYLAVSHAFAVGLIITPFIVSSFALDMTLTARFVSLSVCILLALILLVRSGNLAHFKPDRLILFYCTYVAFCLLSLSWAHTFSEAVFDAGKLILGLFVFLFTYFSLKYSKDFFYSLMVKLPVIMLLMGLAVAIWQCSALPDLKKESIYAVTGMNGHKNLYSSFLFLNLFFLITGYLRSEKLWKVMCAVCIVLTLFLVAFIRTKAVWIGLSVALFCAISLYLLLNRKVPKLNFYFLLACLLVIANVFFLLGLHPLIKKGISSNAEIIQLKPEQRQKAELDNERLVLWDKTYGVFDKHRLTGVGIGNWQISFANETYKDLWRADELNYTFQRPHNDLLWILSETGIFGLNLFLIFLFALLIFILKAARRAGDRYTRSELILCFSVITGYTVVSFFDFPKERIEHLAWINVILGIAYFNIKQNIELAGIANIKSKPVIILAIVLCTFITWVGILRHQGEYYTRKMYDQKGINNYSEVIKLGNKAQSFAYLVDPTSIPISWFMGNAYASLSNYQKAQEEFRRAYELNPYNRNVLNDLASSYALTNNVDMAKMLYKEASRISPRFDEPKLNLAALYLKEQNYREASECLKSIYHDSERRNNYQKMADAFLPKQP